MARKPYNSNQKAFTQKMRGNKLSLGWYIFIAHHVFIRMGISAAPCGFTGQPAAHLRRTGLATFRFPASYLL